MKIAIDTTGPVLKIKLGEESFEFELGNEMAEKILVVIRDVLAEKNLSLRDIDELHFNTGPGSYTGLRIGASVVNVLADELGLEIYDQFGKAHKMVVPIYKGRGF